MLKRAGRVKVKDAKVGRFHWGKVSEICQTETEHTFFSIWASRFFFQTRSVWFKHKGSLNFHKMLMNVSLTWHTDFQGNFGGLLIICCFDNYHNYPPLSSKSHLLYCLWSNCNDFIPKETFNNDNSFLTGFAWAFPTNIARWTQWLGMLGKNWFDLIKNQFLGGIFKF